MTKKHDYIFKILLIIFLLSIITFAFISHKTQKKDIFIGNETHEYVIKQSYNELPFDVNLTITIYKNNCIINTKQFNKSINIDECINLYDLERFVRTDNYIVFYSENEKLLIVNKPYLNMNPVIMFREVRSETKSFFNGFIGTDNN